MTEDAGDDRNFSLTIRPATLTGFAVYANDEHVAAFSSAQELANWIEATLKPLDPVTAAVDMPQVVQMEQARRKKSRGLFGRGQT